MVHNGKTLDKQLLLSMPCHINQLWMIKDWDHFRRRREGGKGEIRLSAKSYTILGLCYGGVARTFNLSTPKSTDCACKYMYNIILRIASSFLFSPYLLFLLGSDSATEYLMVVDLNIREESKCTCERRLCRKRHVWYIQSLGGTNISHFCTYLHNTITIVMPIVTATGAKVRLRLQSVCVHDSQHQS